MVTLNYFRKLISKLMVYVPKYLFNISGTKFFKKCILSTLPELRMSLDVGRWSVPGSRTVIPSSAHGVIYHWYTQDMFRTFVHRLI